MLYCNNKDFFSKTAVNINLHYMKQIYPQSSIVQIIKGRVNTKELVHFLS